MKLSNSLKAFLEEARTTDSYWVEHAKLEFSLALEQQRSNAKLTYAAIAKKLASSAAYISKVFRGDTNMTIETMVKLARATGGQLDIRIVDNAAAVNRWDIPELQARSNLFALATRPANTVTYLSSCAAANHDAYEWWEKAAA